MIAVGGLNLAIGSAGQALDLFTVPYPVFSPPAGGVAHDFHILSLSSRRLGFQERAERLPADGQYGIVLINGIVWINGSQC